MISKDRARQIAADHLGEGKPTAYGVTPVILDDETLERSFGWVFFYQSKEFVEEGNISDSLAGNAPIVVNRKDGSVYVTGTAHPVEHYLEEYERGEGRG